MMFDFFFFNSEQTISNEKLIWYTNILFLNTLYKNSYLFKCTYIILKIFNKCTNYFGAFIFAQQNLFV